MKNIKIKDLTKLLDMMRELLIDVLEEHEQRLNDLEHDVNNLDV